MIVAVLAVTLLPLSSPSPAYAVGTTYYVSNGGSCNDAGPGTSPTAPWCTFSPVNTRGSLAPGEQLLLARGSQWNQQLTLSGKGTATERITLGAYGSGARPKIIRNGDEADRGIILKDPSYWTVSDLEVGHAGTGILVNYSTVGNREMVFQDLFLHDIHGIHQGSGSGNAVTGDAIWNSAGIEFTSKTFSPSNPATARVLDGLTFDRIEGTRNLDTISLDWFNDDYDKITDPTIRIVGNVLFNHLTLHEDNQGDYASTGCDDGMRITGAQYVTMMNSSFDREASCPSQTGTAAIYLADVSDARFFNNSFTHVLNTASSDMVAIDFEAETRRVAVSENYIADNAGAGLSYLAIHGPTPNLTDSDISGNTFVSNGNGSIRRYGNDATPTGTIRENLFHEPKGLTYEEGSNFNGFTFTHNLAIGSRASVFNSSAGFGPSQTSEWSYQSTNGSGWSNLAFFDSTAQRWQPSATTLVPNVSRFEVTPKSCSNCSVARAWTAPVTGTVSIRGRVAKSDIGSGDGVVTRITRNGTAVWPATGSKSVAYNDLGGFETYIDGLSVTAGDIVRFEVSAGATDTGDVTSWMPTVAYTSGPTDAEHVSASWNFDTTGNAEGWTVGNQATQSVSGGSNVINATGSDPYLFSPGGLRINSDATEYIKVRMKNSSSSTRGEFFFTTLTDPTWTAPKSVSATITAADPGYTTYVFDLTRVAAWKGTITQLRFDPIDKAGTVSVDSISVSNRGPAPASARTWAFDTAGSTEGWTAGNDVTQSVSGGVYTLDATGPDPYVFSPGSLGIDAARYGFVKVRMKNNGTNNFAQIYWTTTTSPGWDGTKSIAALVVPQDDGYTDYAFFVGGNPNWTGTISQIRFDPIAGTGTLNIDSISVSNVAY
ncbi:right-handed parallel beta-helix repeat-containing protein [Microbacterium saperdae]